MIEGFSVEQLSLVHKNIQIRPSAIFDISNIVRTERAFVGSPLIQQWSNAEHLSAINSPDWGCWVIEKRDDLAFIGYIISNGFNSEKRKIFLKRFVISERNQGYGRSALQAFQRIIFEHLRYRAIWLCVYPKNTHAKSLYQSEGYMEIGLSPQEKLVMMLLEKDN
ncbi:MAG TPA: GNAT family N-acetyltransferase [Anaerolineales bacterium]|nr:GNAT family N-acetyltransferase [Anaerolineales bacterium]